MSDYIFLSDFFALRERVIYVRYQCISAISIYIRRKPNLFSLLKFKVQSHIAHFCFVYRSPNLAKDSSFNTIDSLTASIINVLELYPDSEIIAAGDFNIHNFNWLHPSRKQQSDTISELFSIFSSLSESDQPLDHLLDQMVLSLES